MTETAFVKVSVPQNKFTEIRSTAEGVWGGGWQLLSRLRHTVALAAMNKMERTAFRVQLQRPKLTAKLALRFPFFWGGGGAFAKSGGLDDGRQYELQRQSSRFYSSALTRINKI